MFAKEFLLSQTCKSVSPFVGVPQVYIFTFKMYSPFNFMQIRFVKRNCWLSQEEGGGVIFQA